MPRNQTTYNKRGPFVNNQAPAWNDVTGNHFDDGITAAHEANPPAGGIVNQVLTKASDLDYDYQWSNPSSSGATRSTQAVDTFAALRAETDVASTELRIVKGRDSVSDGGAGLFQFDTSAAKAFTADPATDVLSSSSHGYITGQPIELYGNSLPAPLAAGTTYYAINLSESRLKLASSATNAVLATPEAIDITSAGSGSVQLAEDGGTVVKPNSNPQSGRWRRVYSGVIDVKWFGAKGDYATNDSPAISKAINAAQALQANVYIPPGVYVVNSAFDPIVKHGTRLFGAGREATILRISANLRAPLIDISGTSSNFVKWCGLENFTIWTPERNYVGDAVRFMHGDRHVVRSVAFIATKGSAIYGRNWWDSYVENCQFESCGDSETKKAAIDLGATDAFSTDVTNNIQFCEIKVEGSYWFGLKMGQNTRRCRFFGAKFHSTQPTKQPSDHILLDGANGNTFHGFNLTFGGGTGVVLLNSADQNSFVGFVVNDMDNWAFDIVSGSGNIVTGSHFGQDTANRSGSLRVQSGSNNIFVGNYTTETVSGALCDLWGEGSPEGVVTAPTGSTYRRFDGGAGTTLYLKESGTGNIGWRAI